jgi:protein gp37
MSKTSIEWTQETWNPTVGCDRISPGCAHCYAKTLHDKRHRAVLDGAQLPAQYLQPFETLQLMPDRLDAPLRRKKPTTYFVNSVSDLFHEDVPETFILDVFSVMQRRPQHTFQILTKRADRMRTVVGWLARKFADVGEAFPLPNVWLGVSVENQHFADERIPQLLQTRRRCGSSARSRCSKQSTSDGGSRPRAASLPESRCGRCGGVLQRNRSVRGGVAARTDQGRADS